MRGKSLHESKFHAWKNERRKFPVWNGFDLKFHAWKKGDVKRYC